MKKYGQAVSGKNSGAWLAAAATYGGSVIHVAHRRSASRAAADGGVSGDMVRNSAKAWTLIASRQRRRRTIAHRCMVAWRCVAS